MGWLNYNKRIYYILLLARVIIIAGATALLTIQAIQMAHYEEKSWLIFAIAGGIGLFMADMQFLYSRQSISYGIDKPMENNYWFVIISILSYAILMILSTITMNLLSYRLVDIIKWVYSINYLRNLLNIAGGLFLVWIVYSGVVITAVLITVLLQKTFGQEEV